jgi:DNA-binding response OmpR family regulator
MPAKILIADDDPTIIDMLLHTLEAQGFEVLVAMDGEAALQLAQRQHPDLVLLDVMMPRLQGFDVCREIRRESSVPILMLTARSEESDHILGLDLGADDYITKPFKSGELLARIRTNLRRSAPLSSAGPAPLSEIARLGNVIIDRRRHAVSRGAATINLSQREYDLLLALLDAQGAAIPRSRLLAKVWGEGWIGDPRTLDVHIRWLREKLEEQPAQPRLLLTVRNVGYRLVSADELLDTTPGVAHGMV